MKILSMLPSRVLRLMEFLGFSGDRELGLSQLREGAASNSLRSILSTLTLLMFHLYMSVILGTGEGNLPEAEALLKPYAEKFPNCFQTVLKFSGVLGDRCNLSC
ncbi:Tetratricopeptide repeat protein 39B [Ilyodon furcidens]|uniref:Tetratricopeptide repeat protein 39B n=1 Tax=Ilyodon furcidens TaxID=33524 RepID=A0ABV0VK12_9TELE